MSVYAMDIQIDGQQQADGQSDRITTQTDGELQERGSAWYLSYVQREESGDTKVIVKLESDRAVMLRSGAGSSRMEFRPGTDTFCDYDTGAGVLTLTVHTDSVSGTVSPRGGRVLLLYSLSAQGMLLSHNQVEITFTPRFDGR